MDWWKQIGSCFNVGKELSSHNKNLETLKSIDEKIVDNWLEEKTLGDLLGSFNKKELELFYSLKITDTGKYGEDQLDLSISIPNNQKEWFNELLGNFSLN